MTDFVASAEAAVRARWIARAAGWNRVAPETVSTADGYNRRMIEAAGVDAGARVLDLASGTGEPAISIALAVGPSGWVVATDGVSEMLAGARRRAAAMALNNVAFAIADMSRLPFGDGVFDALTCRFGIMFPVNSVGAAAEARRVLRRGGRAAFLVHGPEADNPLFRTVKTVALTFLGRETPSKPGQRYRFGESGAISRVLAAAGFAEVDEIEYRDTLNAPADRPIWRDPLERSHADDLARLTAPERGALEERMREAFAPHVEDGAYRLESHVRLGVGRAG